MHETYENNFMKLDNFQKNYRIKDYTESTTTRLAANNTRSVQLFDLKRTDSGSLRILGAQL